MGALVTTLAFPVPDRQCSAANLKRQGERLVWLTIAAPSTDGGTAVLGASTQQQQPPKRIPAIHVRYPNSRYTILHSHGNAEDVGLVLGYLEHLSDSLGVDVLAYEYPGYSIADGTTPSEDCCYQAIQAAYDYLTITCKLSPPSIVLFGRSLGTGPTVHLASQQPDIAGTILQSPLESGIRAVLGPISGTVLYYLDIFRNYEKVEDVQSPVFIVHGESDRVVPCSNGRALYRQLQQRPHHERVAYSPVWVPGRGHNNMPIEHCMLLFAKFLDFLEERQEE
jgi:abhydrolase domain-containing protein 17